MLALIASLAVLGAELDSHITRAVFADGRLWVVTEQGNVFSVAEGEKKKRAEKAGQAMDLCVRGGHVLALVRDGDATALKTVAGDGSWSVLASLADVKLGVLGCTDDAVYVITGDRLVTWSGGKVKQLKLTTPALGVTTAVLAGPDRVLVGINLGEFGGGLRAIDPKTGVVKVIEKKGPDLCDGPLNTECDPVHAVVPAPWKPECTVLAVGLEHFSTKGRLLTLCGEQIEVLVSRKTEGPKDRLTLRDTVAFFGLARAGNVLWAAGVDGLYEVTAKGEKRTALPKFTDVGDVHVSFAVPGLVLVLTEVSRRVSISGAVPMVVAR